ncbi:MAG: hypothetical protein Ta2E_01100 [Mycoplasmoidaceae bacterium]|nr:MAG: hypothetical protein Ta2E_01100 [Mycoplasmoidaceae bacterium]
MYSSFWTRKSEDFVNELYSPRSNHPKNEIISKPEDAIVEYYFNNISSIEDVINAFNEVIWSKSNINNSLKVVWIREELLKNVLE